MSNASDSYANPQKRIFANTEALDEALVQYVEGALLEAFTMKVRAKSAHQAWPPKSVPPRPIAKIATKYVAKVANKA